MPFGWFVEHWYTHRAEVPLRSLLARTSYFLATVGFGAGFVVLASDSTVQDETPHICGSLTTEETCVGWPMLPQDKCDEARGCLGDNVISTSALCDGMMQPNFKCAWLPSRQFNNWTRLVFPAGYVDSYSCVRHRCPLHDYARGVALEFGVLLLTLCYVSSFALHDVRRLLDRPPPEARLVVPEEGGRQPLQISMGEGAGRGSTQ